MSKLALGIIETVGLAAAIDAADAAAKSADIQVIGYELTKGDGMAAVKITGTVGAVKAAIDAAVASAGRINKVWGKTVIPRPANGLEMLIYSRETVGVKSQRKEETCDDALQTEFIDGIFSQMEDTQQEKLEEQVASTEPVDDIPELPMEQDGKEEEDFTQELEGCNLCKDPSCSRRKGDLRTMCIHYEELKREGRI
ncbi:MAG: BMC domain-containing protein [Bacillota bacterium]